MTTEEKTLLTMLTVAAVLVTVTLGAALGWPAWSWPILAVPLLGAPGRMYRTLQRRGPCQMVHLPHSAPSSGHIEQQDPARQTLVRNGLESAFADYKFHFSATAHWRQVRGARIRHENPSELAYNVILDRAQAITKVEQPDVADVVQHRLASVLGAVQPVADSGVEVWADNIKLTLPEADQERLRKISEGRKDRDLWEHEHSHERRKRDYLSNDVLKTTGSTVIWRLAQKDNDVEDTVRLIGTLARLSAAANDKEVDERYRHLVPIPALPGQSPNGSCPDENFSWADSPAGPFSDLSPFSRRWGMMMDTLNFRDEERAWFTHHGAQLIEKFGKPEEAQEIRQRFDSPATDKELADRPTPDGDLPGGPTSEEEPPPQQEHRRNSPRLGEAEQDSQSQADE